MWLHKHDSITETSEIQHVMDFVAPINIKQQTGQIYATVMHPHLLIHN
jgi:hypothetical protein